MYIVVSTGERAARIASKLPDCLIIDRNAESAEKLRKQGFNVLSGDASNPEVLAKFAVEGTKIILADDDDFNVKVGKTAKLLGLDVFAIAVDEEKCWLYEAEGISKVCGSIEALLSTIFEKNRYFEIAVGAEMEGKSLKEYDAGEDCMVLSVFRDGKVMQPFPELELKAGDILGLVCGEQVRVTKNPFDNILLLKGDLGEEEIREAEMVARKFGAELITFEKIGDVYACVLEGYAESIKLEEAVDILRKSDELDLIATTLKEKNEEVLKKLVSSFPTLVLSGRDDYRKILALVNASNPDTIINMAKAFSRFFGRVKVLFLDEEQIKHFSKFTEADLEIEVSKGNPMVDTVKEFKSGYDLVILSLSNDIGNIDRDILWKIILDKETSVLVVE